jgi:heme-degrading monooxygenase HmoA
MHVVIFEVRPRAGRAERYFELAAALREELEQIDGFVSVERFRSLADPDKYLSISFWRDEDAVRRWREHAEHRAAQAAGKAEIFEDFRIRVAEIVRDYGMEDRRNG